MGGMGQGEGLGRGGVPKGPNDETSFRHLCPRLEMRLRHVSSPRYFYYFYYFYLLLA